MDVADRCSPSSRSSSRSCPSPGALTLVTLCALLALDPSPASGQDASIVGRVLTADTGEPVGSATVRLEERGRDQLTDAGGRFRFEGLESGPFRLSVERIGFDAARREGELAPGETLEMTLTLATEAVRSEDLVVTATRSEARIGDVASSVSVLSPDEVDANPARTSDDLLRTAPGVGLPRQSSTVAHPTGQSVSIRGTGGNRTLVLLDGIPLNDAFGGWVRWGLAPTSMVDRVEVLRGGGSHLFGTYAMGGVIQLFPERPEASGLRLEGALGQRELTHGELAARHVSGDWALSVAGQIESGGGYVEIAPGDRGPVDRRASSDRRNVTARAEFSPGEDQTLWAMGAVLDEDRSSGTRLQTNSRTIGTLALGAELGDPDEGRFSATLFGSSQRFDNRNSRTFDGRASEALQLEQDVPVEDVGTSLLWTRALDGPIELTAGADLRYIEGENRETRFAGDGSVDSRFDTGGRQLLGGVFGQAVVTPAGPWRVEASLRMDTWNSFDVVRDAEGQPREELPSQDARELSPRVGAAFQATDELTLRAAAYRTFRAPTLNELVRGFFTSNLSFEPNPRLEPETLRGAEAGADWSPLPSLTLRATGFWNQIENRVDFVFQDTTDGIGRLQRENIGTTRLRGAEAELDWRPTGRFQLSASYTFTDSEILGASSPEAIGNEVSETPRDRASLQAVWDGDTVGRLGVVTRYVGDAFEDEANTVPLDDHLVVGLDWERDLYRGVGAYVAVENLFDEEIVVGARNDVTRLGQPRTLRGGLSYDIF